MVRIERSTTSSSGVAAYASASNKRWEHHDQSCKHRHCNRVENKPSYLHIALNTFPFASRSEKTPAFASLRHVRYCGVEMVDAAPFFVVRDGFFWACWLDGRAAIRLGEVDATASAMMSCLETLCTDKTKTGQAKDEESPEPEKDGGGGDEDSKNGEIGFYDELDNPPDGPQGKYERLENRFDISVPGTVRSGSGRSEIIVTDLSENGCRFRNSTIVLRAETMITIKIGPIGPIDAVVRWRRGTTVGTKFVSPLYPSVMQHIVHHFDLQRK